MLRKPPARAAMEPGPVLVRWVCTGWSTHDGRGYEARRGELEWMSPATAEHLIRQGHAEPVGVRTMTPVVTKGPLR
jgi:hypothetical protein